MEPPGTPTPPKDWLAEGMVPRALAVTVAGGDEKKSSIGARDVPPGIDA